MNYSIPFSSSSVFSLWDRIIPDSDPFVNQVKLLSKETTWTPEKQLVILEALRSDRISKTSKYLSRIFKALPPSELHLVIKNCVKTILTEVQNDPIRYCQKLSKILTLDQIQEALKTEYPSFKSALEAAKELSKYAQYYSETTQSAGLKPIIGGLVTNILQTIDTIIDTFLQTFGLAELEKDIDSPMEANTRLQSLMALFSLVATLLTLTVTILGSTVLSAGIVGAGVLTAGALIAVYIKYLKPAPYTMKGCSNLTSQAKAGDLSAIEGREHYIDEVASALIASKDKPKTHPLLIGRSGVGKTEIMKGFAQAAASGRYPELKDKQVFYVNTADLVNPPNFKSFGSTPLSLEKIKERIKYRPENVILILDEIHQACKSKDGNLAERLKTLLDDGQNGFPFVIAATTDEEYVEYILNRNDPLARRFKQIPICEMNRDQTITILNKKILRQPEGLHVMKEAVEAAYDLSCKYFPERPQPYMASRILAQALQYIKDKKHDNLKTELIKEKAKREKILSSRVIGFGRTLLENQSKDEQFEIIQQKIDEIENLLKNEQFKTNQFEGLVKQLEETKSKLLEYALRIDSLSGQKSSCNIDNILKEFLLLSHYFHIELDDMVLSKSEEFGKDCRLDVSLIEKIIQEEIRLKLEKEKMIQEAKNRKEEPKHFFGPIN